MRELEESIVKVLSRLPEEYQDIAVRLKTNKDWQAVEMVLALIRERILDCGKLSGDGKIFHALEGFDAVFKVLDKIAGVYKNRVAVEKQIFSMKDKEA